MALSMDFGISRLSFRSLKALSGVRAASPFLFKIDVRPRSGKRTSTVGRVSDGPAAGKIGNAERRHNQCYMMLLLLFLRHVSLVAAAAARGKLLTWKYRLCLLSVIECSFRFVLCELKFLSLARSCRIPVISLSWRGRSFLSSHRGQELLPYFVDTKSPSVCLAAGPTAQRRRLADGASSLAVCRSESKTRNLTQTVLHLYVYCTISAASLDHFTAGPLHVEYERAPDPSCMQLPSREA